MTQPVEAVEVGEFLRSVLQPAAAGSALQGKVFRGSMAPQGQVPPYGLFFLQSGLDDRCLPGDWCGFDAVYFVKVVCPQGQYHDAGLPALRKLTQAMETLRGVETVSGNYRYTVMGSDDVREFEEKTDGGQVLVHAGRAWSVAVEPA